MRRITTGILNKKGHITSMQKGRNRYKSLRFESSTCEPLEMLVEAAGLGEFPAAVDALVVFLPGVNRQVLPESRVVGEHSGTVAAGQPTPP